MIGSYSARNPNLVSHASKPSKRWSRSEYLNASMALTSGVTHRPFETYHLDAQEKLVVLRDESGVRDIEPDGVKALEGFAHTLWSAKKRAEDLAPVVFPANDQRVVSKVGVFDQGPLAGAALLSFPLLLLPTVVDAVG